MRSHKDLHNKLLQIDGKGYKSYKEISGQYEFDNYILSIDSVQGDPFASPSKGRIIVYQDVAKFPANLFDKAHKNTAVCDFLTRLFHHSIHKYYNRVNGSGKSGLLFIDKPGQEILRRTSVIIDDKALEARFEVGLPAAGRRILAREAIKIFFTALPKIVENTLYYKNINASTLKKHVDLAVDQYYLRNELKKKGLIAFIANNSILPRETGISDKPLTKGAAAFISPKNLEVELILPNKGKITGMGIPKGITLIVGGGYHGKSTVLKALERSVYDHIEGDGREFVITIDNAVKIRSEDGRRVEKVDISPFINNLPNGQDTEKFSTENASGSTSQAANIMEAIEIGTDLLLIDEDTCATNFMVRDKKMQKLVEKDKEPITPFIDRVRYLYENLNISTVMVAGSSGEYFNVADNIIMMDKYVPYDVTDKAKEIAEHENYNKNNKSFNNNCPSRILLSSSFPKTHRGIKIKAKGLNTIIYNKTEIDLKYLEQLVDSSQTNCIGVIIQYIAKNFSHSEMTISSIVNKVYKTIENKGLDSISTFTGHPGNLALPRKHEIIAALNRFRLLRIK
ncbi:ABC-ATPase domain-containing protein [Paramaledivibacter caminithermalis]|uniref:Predicted ATPase of the ABC class n=1 Tax=Paramaledivibacter caminithermalis (strain DSM 15212 / CIP 107654 / DViRD3) TaxID=1121301 RepID=A0A1M6NNH0_PARC5|nr:ABC-ATPase domain-containing protein [Paramaledivibacter caminithermalis]SHJ97235.1 Predicted ATPase of the ABC class [Paramaledivibacter caminithermalis DSM 15212]